MKRRFVLILASLAALVTSTSEAEELPHYLREAEHATLAGKSWIMNDAASGGSSVSLQGSPVTWKAVTQAGTYRLLARVPSGYSQDHFLYVRPKMSYSAEIDGVARSFQTIEATAVYHGDESCFVWLETEPFGLAKGVSLLLTAPPRKPPRCSGSPAEHGSRSQSVRAPCAD